MIVRNDIITEANLVQQSFIGNRLALDGLNPASYPGTGDKWYDLSGNNNTMTLFGTPSYFGNEGAINFNGTDQYGSRTSTPSLNIDGSKISMEIWFRLDGTGEYFVNAKLPFSGGPGNQNGNYAFWLGVGIIALASQDSSQSKANYLRVDGTFFTTGSWNQLVVTYDNPFAYYYINGTLIARLPRYGDNPEYGYHDLFRCTGDYYITGRADGYGKIDGDIAVMNLFDYVLSEDQVLYNYNYYSPRFA
jgi:hypothetical protein